MLQTFSNILHDPPVSIQQQYYFILAYIIIILHLLSLTPQEYQKQIAPLDLRPGVAAWQGFICEFLQGALLMFVAITVFDGKNRTVRLPALAIGAAVGANIMIFVSYF